MAALDHGVPHTFDEGQLCWLRGSEPNFFDCKDFYVTSVGLVKVSCGINRFSCLSCCRHLLFFFQPHSLVSWFFFFLFSSLQPARYHTLPACGCCGNFLFLLVLLSRAVCLAEGENGDFLSPCAF